jgi:hypothetical protein
MANQLPDAETARDLEALPADLQPLYRRLTDDGAAWQAASAAKFASLARALVADVERIASDGAVDAQADNADDTPQATPVALPVGAPIVLPAHRHKREWIFGTVAAVAVVALLALVLQGVLAGRGSTGPTNTKSGQWQILDKLTWKRASSGQVLPSIAPTNPQVVYEATNLVNGAAETSKVVSYASLRRTEDGGESWRTLTLPLPIADVSTINIVVSPLRAQTVFMSLWDRSSTACEPTNGVVGEGCERGYVSYDGGDTWVSQRLPVRGILDLSQPFAVQFNRLYAQNVCNDASCVHLLISADGGLTWQVIDGQLSAQGQLVCAYAATPSGGKVYVITTTVTAGSQLRCMQASSDVTMWRSDDAGISMNAADAGTHWTQLGPLPSDPQGSAQRNAISGNLLSAPGVGLVYLNLAYMSANSGPMFLYSEDYGVTWKHTPPVPATPTLPVTSVTLIPYPELTMMGETAALSDGSLLYIQFGTLRAGMRLTPYVWTLGASAWQRLPALPAEVSGPGSITVTPGASGHDTITTVLRANGDASNPIAYYVVRYQM